MKKVLVLVVSFLCVISNIEAKRVKVSFNECVDGDTAWFNIKGSREKFRFLAIDTPESVHPTKEVQQYGKEASSHTCDLLKGASKIEIEYDENSDKQDKYGRNLAWVWIDDILIEQLLIKDGYAQVAYVYGKYQYLEDLCKEQSLAMEEKIGIWSEDREEGYCSKIDYSKGIVLDKNMFNVKFMLDDEVYKEFNVVEGKKIKEFSSPTKTGFKFKGWYLEDEKYDFSDEINDDTIYSARFDLDYLYIAIAIIVVIVSLLTGKKGKRKNGKNSKKSIKLD